MMYSLSSFEKKQGGEELKVLEFYKFDYISRHLAFAFIRFTLCFIMCAAIYVLFNIKSLFYNINLSGIQALVKNAVLIYAAGLSAYFVITWVVYSLRYDRALSDIEDYTSMLKLLDRRFNKRGRRQY